MDIGDIMTAEIAKRCTGECDKCPVWEICKLLRQQDEKQEVVAWQNITLAI